AGYLPSLRWSHPAGGAHGAVRAHLRRGIIQRPEKTGDRGTVLVAASGGVHGVDGHDDSRIPRDIAVEKRWVEVFHDPEEPSERREPRDTERVALRVRRERRKHADRCCDDE